jgi:hypothetical protein
LGLLTVCTSIYANPYVIPTNNAANAVLVFPPLTDTKAGNKVTFADVYIMFNLVGPAPRFTGSV